MVKPRLLSPVGDDLVEEGRTLCAAAAAATAEEEAAAEAVALLLLLLFVLVVVLAWLGLGAGVTSHGSSRGRRRLGLTFADFVPLLCSFLAHAGGGRSVVGSDDVSGPAEGARFFEIG